MNRYISKSYTTSKNTIDRQYTERGSCSVNYYKSVNEWKKKRILHVQIYQFAIQVLWLAMCVDNLSVFLG